MHISTSTILHLSGLNTPPSPTRKGGHSFNP